MILDFSKRIGELDEDLSTIINVVDGMYTIGVFAEGIGTIYSFSSTDVNEVYTKVNEFVDTLTDEEKFEELLEKIENEPLEV